MAFWNSSQILVVNDGVQPNDGTGDAIRNAFIKVNENFSNISLFLQQTGIDFLNANVEVNLSVGGFANIGTVNTTVLNATSGTFASNLTVGNLIATTGVYSTGDALHGGNFSAGKNAVIGGNAVINGYTTIGSYANIGGPAVIAGYATIGSYATIGGNVTATGNAVIGGYTTIGSNANIGGYAGVAGSANIGGQATIGGNITAAGNAVVGGSATIGGNATIGGAITIGGSIVPTANLTYNLGSPTMYFNNAYVKNLFQTTTTTISATSSIIELQANTGATDVGILGNLNTLGTNFTYFGYESSTQSFVFKDAISIDPTAHGFVVSGGTYGPVHFGNALLSNTTPSTSTTTGALVVGGGAGFGGNINVAGNSVVAGFANIGSYAGIVGYANIGSYAAIGGYATIGSNANIGGYIGVAGSANIGGYTQIGGALNVGGTVTTTANVAGSYFIGNVVGNTITTGNLNISGNIFGNLTVSGTIAAQGGQVLTTNTPGIGTFYNAGSIFTTPVLVNITTTSNSTSTGALVVGGGGGFGGNVYSGANVYAAFGLVGPLYGTVMTAAQPNITSLGTITSLSAGSISASSINLGAGTVTAGTVNSSAITGLNSLIVGGNITTGNVSGSQGTFSTVQGTLITPAQPNITSVGSLTGLQVVGNTSTGNLTVVSSVYASAYNYSNGAPFVSTAIANTAQIGANVTSGTVGLSLIATGVTAGTYGSATAIPAITVGADGRITSATTNAVSTTINLAGGSGSGSVSGGGTLTAIGGTGISTSISSSTITITNTGVTSAVAGTGVGVSGATGAVTFSIGQAVGTGNSPTFAGITVPSITHSGTNGSGDIGASGATFGTVWAKATSALYADLAENYVGDADYAPGTVVIFGGDAEITTTTQFADVRIAGAISTNPAYLMNNECAGLPVALRGRIPVQVIGPVTKGDLLVTAGQNPGYATSIGKSTEYPLAVFAKSLETNTADGTKIIEAVIL